MRKQNGVAVLTITIIVLAIVTIITVFTARMILTDNKIYGNVQNNATALNAAQAGLDYALGYLNNNASIVIATAAPGGLNNCSAATNTVCLASGVLKACTPAAPAQTTGPTNALPNSANYTMKYSCMTAGNKNILTISSYGTSPDGSSTRTAQEMVEGYGGVSNAALFSVGAATLGSGSVVQNGIAGGTATTTIIDGGTVSLAGTSKTTLNGVTSSVAGNIKSDIQQSNSTMAGFTPVTLQTTYLGKLITAYASSANITLTCALGSTTLDVKSNGSCGASPAGTVSGPIGSGKVIYVNMTAGGTLTLGKKFTLGAGSTLVVHNAAGVDDKAPNGVGNDTTISGALISDSPIQFSGSNQTVNGLVFTTSTLATATGNGTTIINGAAVVGSTTNTTAINAGAISIVYTPANLVNYPVITGSGSSGGVLTYGLVSGSWKDF